MFKNIQKYLKSHHVIALFGLLILIIALGQFSDRKTNEVSNFASGRFGSGAPVPQSYTAANRVQRRPNEEEPTLATPPCSAAPTLKPADLLPSGGATGGQLVGNANFLQAGAHAGINTTGSSLRNANLQIRSEPANPVTSVSPWMNTTIEPDLQRRSLEIGCES